jgi:hypothetical protein
MRSPLAMCQDWFVRGADMDLQKKGQQRSKIILQCDNGMPRDQLFIPMGCQSEWFATLVRGGTRVFQLTVVADEA